MTAPTVSRPTDGTTPRSDRKLSEVTKYLIRPTGIVRSDWPTIRDVCRNDLGIEFDRWQDGVGLLMLAKRNDGSLAHTIGGFGMSICRQTGKTFNIAGAVFGLCVKYPGLLVIWSAHHSKALDCETELLTVNRGWVTMGTAQVGDMVVHPSGRATRITGVSDVMVDHDCYEVTTTDGRSIVADAEHLWTVTDKYRKRSSGSGADRKRWLGAPETYTTEEMYQRGLGGTGTVHTRGKEYQTSKYRFLLPRQNRIAELLPKDLLIDPYIFGAWLGDGQTHYARLCSGNQDLQHWIESIHNAGFVTALRQDKNKVWDIGINGAPGPGQDSRSLYVKLRKLKVLGNKHIPEQFLLGSTDQRLALLQGLLDTDGTINTEGTVYFTSTKQCLSEGVLFLARSLGWRATIHEGKSKLNGQEHGPIWRVTFTPNQVDGIVPFRIPRKAERIRLEPSSSKGRFASSIKSIEPVASRPVRCIKVAENDGLFLAGRDLIPTHNTHMETFMAMQGFAARTKIAPFIDKVYTGSGDEEIRFVNGSRILFGARERGFGRGIPGVDVLIMDEGQILSIKAMRNMLATLNTSRLGLHIYAGTPPYPEDNCEVWMQMRDEALSGESTDSAWIEMGADDDITDLDDVEQWMKANCSVPHRTPLISMKRMRKMLDDIGFKHEALGVYDKVTGSEFDMAKWSTLIELEAPAPEQVTLMLDVSPDRRWTTIAVAGEIAEDRALVMVESLKGTSGVVKRVEQLLDQKDIIEVAIFNGGTARILKPDLTQAGIEFESLTAGEMAGAYGYLQESIRHGTVAHVDQPELNTALRHAKTRFLQTGEAETIDRRDNLHTNTSPAIAAAGALYRFGLLQSPMPVIL